MKTEGACPCSGAAEPAPVSNPPAQPSLRYRVGTFTEFRAALLRARPGERELSGWRPGAEGDLGVAALEWWAYLADVLTLYNEQIANRAYLRTAGAGDVERIVRLLGYRARPGLGATATIGAVVQGRASVTLPAGLGVQSKPGPGEQPQVFELDEDTVVAPGGDIAADIVSDGPVGQTVYLRGSVSVTAGEPLLLVKKDWTGSASEYASVTVATVTAEKDPAGRPVTRVDLTAAPGLALDVSQCRLLRHALAAHVLSLPTGVDPLSDTVVHLDAPVRSLAAGALLGLSHPGSFQLTSVGSYTEVIWYANGGATTPSVAPTGSDVVPVPILHAQITLGYAISSSLVTDLGALEVRHGYRDVGELITLGAGLAGATTATLKLASALPGTAASGEVLVEDATGSGAAATATTTDATRKTVAVAFAEAVTLTAPLRVLTNLLAVSRGQTVKSETLGGGDATIAGQSFELKKSPVTYQAATDPDFPRGYKSTARVWVDGVEWSEVETLYGQRPSARVFVTREDEDAKTTVVFGDGVNGARLPTGRNNVVASYRTGSGATAPAAGALSVLLSSVSGLSSVRAPVAPAGGEDAAAAEDTRALAPRSVLTFGRAIAADDYEALALEAPGVTRARAWLSWDAGAQRTTVKVYVQGDSDAAASARASLEGVADPNRVFAVEGATALDLTTTLRVRYDDRYDEATVRAAVEAALLDGETGVSGTSVLKIGQAIYESQVVAAVMAVPGVVAVHDLVVTPDAGVDASARPRYSPGEGGVLAVVIADDGAGLTMEAVDVGE